MICHICGREAGHSYLCTLEGESKELLGPEYEEEVVDRQRYTIEGDAPTPPPVR